MSPEGKKEKLPSKMGENLKKVIFNVVYIFILSNLWMCDQKKTKGQQFEKFSNVTSQNDALYPPLDNYHKRVIHIKKISTILKQNLIPIQLISLPPKNIKLAYLY